MNDVAEDVQWGRTRAGRSWHIVGTPERGPRSRCGRLLVAVTIVEDRPGGEATCESCLRMAGPR